MSPDVDKRIELEQIAMICRSSINIFVALAVLGAAVTYVITLDRPLLPALSWYGSFVTIAATRWCLHIRFLKRDRKPEDLPKWRWIMLLGAGATGAMWTIPGTLLLPPGFNAQLFLCGAIMGVAATAANTLAPMRYTYLAFLVPMLLPMSIVKVLEGGDNVTIGLGLLFFGMGMVAVAIRNHGDITRMLRLSFENEAMAARVVDENSRFERANRDLQAQIAERERAELSLRSAKAEAEEANRAKSSFLANMSHEVRTPLNAIMGMTELLRRSSLDKRQAKYADTAYHAGERLLGILNDILDISRVEAGRLRLQKTEFGPRRWLTEVLDLMNPSAISKRLDLASAVDSTVPEVLQGDAERLRQVLVNLISNAIKFTHRGTVQVRLTAVEVPQCVWLRCEVEDSGIGIDGDAQNKLFQPFTQLDGSITRRYGGTGLGLAISRQLIEAMGGRIGVDSTAGKGSRFWFEVPLDATEPRVHSQSLHPTKELTALNAHVLVAEDNEVNRTLLLEMLQSAGCSTVVARTGLEALERLSKERFDVVLMDWHMPELDGLSATRVVRSEEARFVGESRRLPIIALTARAMTADKEECMAAGVDDYISKPYRYETLVSTLRKWVPSASDESVASN